MARRTEHVATRICTTAQAVIARTFSVTTGEVAHGGVPSATSLLSVTVSRSVFLTVLAARCLGLAVPVVWVAGGAVRGFVLGFWVYDLDHRPHPVLLVEEDVAVEHELPGEVGEAATHLYRTVG